MNRIYSPPNTNQRFGACVASILEIEPGQAPTFEKVEAADLPQSVSEFVKPYGLAYLEVQFDKPAEVWPSLTPLGFWIFRGPSARGEFTDAVVMLGKDLYHDPGNEGYAFAVDELNIIFDGTAETGWAVGVFIPFDPLRVRRHVRPGSLR